MNAPWKYGLLVLTLAALVMGAWLVPAGAGEDEDGDEDTPLSLADVASHLSNAKVSLSTACDTAAKAAKGTAFAAEFEVEGGKVLYDVLVLVPGTPPKLFEVEVDAVTGKVMEIEQENGDDDEGDDDDDDEGGDDD